MDGVLYDVKVGGILVSVRGWDEALKTLDRYAREHVERWGEFPEVGIRKFPYRG